MNRRDVIRGLPLGAASAFLPPAPAQPNGGRAHLRTAICAYGFRDELSRKTMRYEDLLELASNLGVDGLDLTVYWLPNTSDDYLLSLRRLAYRLGIDIYSISIRAIMCRATPESQAAEVEQLKRWLDVAGKLGARHIRVFGGSVPKGATVEQAEAWTVETLRQCAAVAGARGIVLGVEDDGEFTENAERLVRMVRKADSQWAGINLDIGNFKNDAYRQVALCLPQAVNVHLKSEVRENGTQQPADWDRLIGMIAPVYRGYMALEYEGKENPRVAVPQVMGQIQQALRKRAFA